MSTARFSNIRQVTAPMDLARTLGEPGVNGAFVPLPPCRYAGLIRYLPLLARLEDEEGLRLFHSGTSGKGMKETISAYVSRICAAGVPAALAAALNDDLLAHHRIAQDVLGTDHPRLQFIVRGPRPVQSGAVPDYYDAWHADWGVSQVYLWTPISEHATATDVVADANVDRAQLWEAWRGALVGDQPDALKQPAQYLRDPSDVFSVPNNALLVFLGEIVGTLPNGEADGSTHLPDGFRTFNAGLGLVHRSPPVEAGKWRLVVRFYSHALPASLHAKLA